MTKFKNGQLLSRLKDFIAFDTDEALSRLLVVIGVLAALYACLMVGHRLLNPTHLTDFPIPENVCVINGQPQIVTADTRTMSQQYIRDDGVIVTRTYDRDLTGSLYVKYEAMSAGGICGSTAR